MRRNARRAGSPLRPRRMTWSCSSRWRVSDWLKRVLMSFKVRDEGVSKKTSRHASERLREVRLQEHRAQFRARSRRRFGAVSPETAAPRSSRCCAEAQLVLWQVWVPQLHRHTRQLWSMSAGRGGGGARQARASSGGDADMEPASGPAPTLKVRACDPCRLRRVRCDFAGDANACTRCVDKAIR